MSKLPQIRQQVGQLLIMGFDGVEPTEKLRDLLARLRPGGVILFKRNIVEARQTWELLRACRESSAVPMFLCVDMEGGTVDRLRDAIAPALSVEEVAASAEKKTFREHGRIIGEEVRALGFNTDFAPVLDLRQAASRSVMGTRTASHDPKEATIYAREFLRGLRQARVLGCGKHFPGLGEASLDTHHELPSVNKAWPRLWEEDLFPYRALRRELPFVMVAHAAYPAVTDDATPASLSPKWIRDILRKKIGYRGLIVSDDLEMGGVLSAAPIEQAAVETIRAGSDIFLVCHNEEHVLTAYEAVVSEAERDRKFGALAAAASARVLAFKKKTAELRRPAPMPGAERIERLRQRIRAFSEQVKTATVVM